MSKKYYWLKLNDNFFEDDTIVYIEEQENGKEYVIFYLKLLLKSLKEEGKLIRYVGELVLPYDEKALAKLTNTNIDTVKSAMSAFIEIGLIKTMETGELYLTQIDEMIGSETDSARRVRKHRALKNNQLENQKLLQCNSDVTKCNTEIEIEKELELEKELEKPKIPFKQIIDYLNEKADRQFKSVESNNKHIRARWNEGYNLEDFKKVIDIKTAEWLTAEWVDNRNGKLVQGKNLLRPSTLFGTKFDNYLNQEVEENNYNAMETPEEIPLTEENEKERLEMIKKLQKRFS